MSQAWGQLYFAAPNPRNSPISMNYFNGGKVIRPVWYKASTVQSSKGHDVTIITAQQGTKRARIKWTTPPEVKVDGSDLVLTRGEITVGKVVYTWVWDKSLGYTRRIIYSAGAGSKVAILYNSAPRLAAGGPAICLHVPISGAPHWHVAAIVVALLEYVRGADVVTAAESAPSGSRCQIQ